MIGNNFKDVTDNPANRLSDSPLGELINDFPETPGRNYDLSLATEPESETAFEDGETNTPLKDAVDPEKLDSGDDICDDSQSVDHREVAPEIEETTLENYDEYKQDNPIRVYTQASDAENANTEETNDNETASEKNETKETRELTDEEKQKLKDTLGWSDKQIAKCTIDEDGVIHYKTDNCELEGKTSETGVPYERKTIEINGVTIEGVFPKFDSAFDTELSPEKYKSKAYATECNKNLKEAIANDPDLRSKFTEEQLKDIEEGRTPTGYVWHHNEETGKMQLVKDTDHRANRHTGGSALWGPDSTDNSKKGENF